jgi:hypothetical protein
VGDDPRFCDGQKTGPGEPSPLKINSATERTIMRGGIIFMQALGAQMNET